jgi:hypothetical protein
LVSLTLTWLQLRGRYTFENLYRQGLFSAVTYRKQFSKGFDFKQFNHLLIDEYAASERIFAFDPSFISKSGKHTHGIGYFCGAARRLILTCFSLRSLVQAITSPSKVSRVAIRRSKHCLARAENSMAPATRLGHIQPAAVLRSIMKSELVFHLVSSFHG